MDKGYVHVYTGNGKGKTTAAFGLAVRAALSGKKVFIGQFIKDMKYNETKITDYLKNITVKQLGCGCFIDRQPAEEDVRLAALGLEECAEAMKSGDWDVVIMDELTIAICYKLIDIFDVIEALDGRAEKTEVVITGRYAPKELTDCADLVTEMCEVKHYYTQGVLSRDGIDR